MRHTPLGTSGHSNLHKPAANIRSLSPVAARYNAYPSSPRRFIAVPLSDLAYRPAGRGALEEFNPFGFFTTGPHFSQDSRGQNITFGNYRVVTTEL
jgi:hypothetical protein